MSNRKFWKCPECGREFRRKGQSHSCLSYPIEYHFQGKPSCLKATFDYLLEKLKEFGPIRIDSVKTAINLAARAHFCMVYVQKNSMKLEFLSDRAIKDERIIRDQKIHDNAYIYFVKLSKIEDVDAQLLAWLKEAYILKK